GAGRHRLRGDDPQLHQLVAARHGPTGVRRAAGRRLRQLQRHRPHAVADLVAHRRRRPRCHVAHALHPRHPRARPRHGHQPRRQLPAQRDAGPRRHHRPGVGLDRTGWPHHLLRSAGRQPRVRAGALVQAPRDHPRRSTACYHHAGSRADRARARVPVRYQPFGDHRVRGWTAVHLPAGERSGEMIRVTGLTKRYGHTAVVDQVSVDIQRGGITAIIGPNGAGKSTMLSLVSRLMKRDEGSVTIDGDDIDKLRSDELARRISVLRQDNHLAVRLTVEDLVAFGRYPYSKGRPTIEDREHIENAITYLELGPLRHRFLDELSGGQRQRAFVAMVLCQDTDYVLLDEPLASLDMRHAVAMMKRLRDVTDELGKTVVLVLHDINFASTYADSIIAMKDGRVVQHADPASVMTTPVLREI